MTADEYTPMLARISLQKVDCCFNKVQLAQLHDVTHAFLSAYSASLSSGEGELDLGGVAPTSGTQLMQYPAREA